MKRSLQIGALLLFMSAGSGCYNDNLEDMYPGSGGNCPLDTVSFKGTVQPIMNQSCAVTGCHDASTATFGIDLSTYAGVQAIANNGRLVGTITHASGFSPMPKNGDKLDACKISQIQKWVTAGAPNN